MDNVKGTLVILVLVLAATTFVLFIRQGMMSSQLDDAYGLAAVTSDLLDAQGIRCAAPPEQYSGITECILPLLAMDDFEQDAFKQPDDKRETPGYLVIKNTNQKAFQSEEFTFYKNRVLLQTGCTVPGEIGFDVTCRFEFPDRCEEGDILEAFYPIDGEDVRVFLRTC